MNRRIIETTDLGQGLARQLAAYHCDVSGELLGTCAAVEAAGVALEVATLHDAADFPRRPLLFTPDGRAIVFPHVGELVQLAQLLRRDEVLATLASWAAEDAARAGEVRP